MLSISRFMARSDQGYAKHIQIHPRLVFLMSILTLSLIVPLSANALASMSQGYTATDTLAIGSIVSLENNTSDRVIASATSNVDSILGVVINDNSTPLSLSNGQDNQVQVITSGIAPVLVSNINGDIAQGDQITASPIKGVGMKATTNTKVVGIAQGTPRNSSENQSYTDDEGEKRTIILGEVPVLVNASYFFKQPEKTIIPSSVQSMANALAGKSVSTVPILISAAIFIVTLIVVASIIYSMIRSSIISVGRNPMSQSAIYRDVIQLSALVLGILAVSLVSIYIILTRF
jgi:hypothetical protein